MTNQISSEKEMPDLNQDGKVDNVEMEFHIEQSRSRRKMAWVALFSLLGTVGFILGFAEPSTISDLGAALDWYFASVAAIISAFMGVEVLTKKGK